MRRKKSMIEIKCDACGGTGFPPVKQPSKAGRKIYPAPCKRCAGKGRIRKPAKSADS
jgi:DnaJ-class molecular chaperone